VRGFLVSVGAAALGLLALLAVFWGRARAFLRRERGPAAPPPPRSAGDVRRDARRERIAEVRREREGAVEREAEGARQRILDKFGKPNCFALVAIAAGLSLHSSPAIAAEASPKALEGPMGAYDASACATLERKCWTTEDGKPEVRCERPAFARALLGCVDLWEAERLCAESLTSSRDLYSVDLEAWTAELGRLEQERNAMRLQGWVWLALGVVGWGAATGFLIWGAAK